MKKALALLGMITLVTACSSPTPPAKSENVIEKVGPQWVVYQCPGKQYIQAYFETASISVKAGEGAIITLKQDPTQPDALSNRYISDAGHELIVDSANNVIWSEPNSSNALSCQVKL